MYACARFGGALALAGLLGGCVTAGYGLNQPLVAEESAMPPDAVAVAAAVVEGLRGANRPPDGIAMPAATSAGLREAGFAYGGFAVRSHALHRYSSVPQAADRRVSAGEIAFADAAGRTTTVLYYADYRLAPSGIEIVEARAATLYALSPRPLAFVVPAEALAQAGGLPTTHAALMEFAARNAVEWTAAQAPTGPRDYVVMVFLLDRVSPSALLEIKVADTATGTAGYKDASQYVDVDGWRVGLVPGRFALEGGPLYAKAVFTPGAEVGFGARAPRLVGAFPLDLREARRIAPAG